MDEQPNFRPHRVTLHSDPAVIYTVEEFRQGVDAPFLGPPPPPPTASPRHTCHCGKAYIRPEHLRRHQTTHSNGTKPYSCHVCGRAFWRNDIFQRHAKSHVIARPTKQRACSTCHANKTKCDGIGDSPCSFCVRKSLNCVYSPTRLNNQSTLWSGSRSIPQKHGVPATTDQSVQNALPAAKDRANRTLDLERENSSDQHASPATLSVASEPILEDEISQGPVHLNTILEELSTSPPKSTPLQDANSPRTLDKWILACFRSYIAHFHHRWHIITASTYEFTEKPPDNAASVVMVGSYFLHRKDLTGTIVNIHDRLVDRYLHLLTSALEEGKLSNTVRRLETYQAILLNIIFGLYLGRQRTIARANLLCGRLIATLQHTGFFLQSYAQHIQQSEFPGHYVPWIDMVLDEWKRIICALFKVETQIALIYHQRPRLLDDELDAFLPSSFALRNCFRMDVFLHRRKIEDPSRSQVKMLRMIRHPEKFLPNAVLVEDIHLGLCGLLFDTLRQAQLRAVIGTWDDPSAIAMRDGVVQRLAVWAKHLKALAEKSRSDGSSLADMQFISTYLDREDEIRSRPLDMRLVKARVKSMINEVTMLYHLLQLLLSVGRRIIEHLKFMAAINLDSIKEDERVRYDEAKSVLESWAGSTEGRTALLHALAMLSIAQVYLKEHSAVLEYPFPGSISHITIALSALVLDGWLAHKYSTCCCGTTAAHLDLPIKSWGLDDAVLEAWIQYDGPALFQGKTLCTCSSDVWIERFANCLPEEETWELAGLIAPPLRSFMRRM